MRVHGPAVSTSEHLRLREGVRAQPLMEEGSQVQHEGVGAASGTGTGAAGRRPGGRRMDVTKSPAHGSVGSTRPALSRGQGQQKLWRFPIPRLLSPPGRVGGHARSPFRGVFLPRKGSEAPTQAAAAVSLDLATLRECDQTRKVTCLHDSLPMEPPE